MARIYMNDLAAMLIEKHGMARLEALRFLEAFVETIQEGIDRDRLVKLRGLGTFKLIDVEARKSISVNTGESLVIEGHPKLTFTPDATLKDLINKPFSAFETVILNDGVTFEELNEAAEEPYGAAGAEEAGVPDEAAEAVEEPAVEEPTVEEPVVEEPMVEEPVVEEPAVEEPVIEEPVVEEPVIEEPVVEEPVVEEPVVSSTNEDPIAEVSSVGTAAPDVHTEGEGAAAPETLVGNDATLDSSLPSPPVATRARWWLWLLCALAACGLTFYVGYLVGHRQTASQTSESVIADNNDAPADNSIAPADSIGVVSTDTPNDSVPTASEALPTAADAQNGESTASTTVAADSVADPLVYEAMDQRVRTGAYNIIGTAEIIKAKAGDTSRSIARRTLGQGMECYIEVYNGINGSTVLSEGQEVKLPKLRVKKAARSKFRRK